MGEFTRGLCRRHTILATGIVCVYLILAGALTVTKRPGFDEAAYANPALDLITRGSMGMTIWDPLGQGSAPGKDQVHVQTHDYYNMPLSILGQAVMYKLIGFGLYRMRVYSMLWGLAALASWGFIIRVLADSWGAALMATFLVATDRAFLEAATSGRPDMMSAALGSLSIAAYLALRGSRLDAAILASQTCVAAALFAHPVGFLAEAALVVLVLRFDLRRLRWTHIALVVLPFAVGFGLWGLYIAKDPDAFRAQFGRNAAGRASGLVAPLQTLMREVPIRFFDLMYLPPYATGVRRLTVLIPILYFLSAIDLLFRKQSTRLLGILAVVNFFVFGILEQRKHEYFLVHLTPLFACCLGIWVWSEWSEASWRRWTSAGVVALLVVLQTSWIAYSCWMDPYRKAYLPAMAFLEQRAGGKSLIMGDAELGFYFGFYNNVVDDSTLGYYSGKRPEFIVVDENGYAQVFEDFYALYPDLGRFVRKTLNEDFKQVFTNRIYTIYQRRQPRISP
jgi:hypothetical protein